jgi:hypothetical protein
MSEPEAEPLPPVHIAEIDRATLADLFADVEALGEDLAIVLKHTAEGNVDAALAPSLEDAMRHLTRGTALGAQLRYRFRGAQWWDTVMSTPQGFRLVRIQHRAAEESVHEAPVER